MSSRAWRPGVAVLAAALLALTSQPASASPPNPPPAADTAAEAAAQRVLAAEDAYVAAEVSRDEAALRRLVDDRFVFNRADGRTTGKEALIEGVMGMSMVGQEIRERSVLVEGRVALVFGTADLHFETPDGGRTVSSLRYTSTWVERDGAWRMLALQMQGRPAD